jgi:hypothetical protein
MKTNFARASEADGLAIEGYGLGSQAAGLAIGAGYVDIQNDDLNPISLVSRNGGGSSCIRSFGPGA